jgi:hypothetical protein
MKHVFIIVSNVTTLIVHNNLEQKNIDNLQNVDNLQIIAWNFRVCFFSGSDHFGVIVSVGSVHTERYSIFKWTFTSKRRD